jgi:hypothetical protein
MTLDFSSEGKVNIILSDCIENVLDGLPEDIDGVYPTPVANHLFYVNKDPEPLDKELAEFFHYVIAQLLFLCKRAQPDIQTAQSFECTQVKLPDIDDYKMRSRVIRYLRGTLHMNLMLEANDANIMKWWVDASYGVHHDLKSRTGGIMTLGNEETYATSTCKILTQKAQLKQNL